MTSPWLLMAVESVKGIARGPKKLTRIDQIKRHNIACYALVDATGKEINGLRNARNTYQTNMSYLDSTTTSGDLQE